MITKEINELGEEVFLVPKPQEFDKITLEQINEEIQSTRELRDDMDFHIQEAKNNLANVQAQKKEYNDKLTALIAKKEELLALK